MCLSLLAAVFAMPAFALAQASPGRVDFGQEPASEVAHQVADWVIDANNNRGLPFLIIDKMDAKAYVFHSDGRLRGAAPVLLGMMFSKMPRPPRQSLLLGPSTVF